MSRPAESEASGSTARTAGIQHEPDGSSPEALVSFMRGLESDARLDEPAQRLAAVADFVVRSPKADDALRGTWLGHALHPLLTDFPLGAWTSASFLDLFGGPDARRRSAHRSAVALGVAGGLVATMGGYLGGHLSLVRKIGTTDAAFGPDRSARFTGSGT
jgi:hypothetical protein